MGVFFWQYNGRHSKNTDQRAAAVALTEPQPRRWIRQRGHKPEGNKREGFLWQGEYVERRGSFAPAPHGLCRRCGNEKECNVLRWSVFFKVVGAKG